MAITLFTVGAADLETHRQGKLRCRVSGRVQVRDDIRPDNNIVRREMTVRNVSPQNWRGPRHSQCQCRAFVSRRSRQVAVKEIIIPDTDPTETAYVVEVCARSPVLGTRLAAARGPNDVKGDVIKFNSLH